MYLTYSTLCSLAALLSYASGYVMLAANIEDVRSLADKYIPESLADEILNRARDGVIRDRYKQYENERAGIVRGRHKIIAEPRSTLYSYKHVNRQAPTEAKKHKSPSRINRKNDTKRRYPSYEMNLDDLVAKVKKRLQIELKLIEASADKHVQARYKKQSRDDADETILAIDRISHNHNHKIHSQPTIDYEIPSIYHDSVPSFYDHHHRLKTQQSRDDTELTIRQVERPSHHHVFEHKPESQKYKNNEPSSDHDRHYRPEHTDNDRPEQHTDNDRPTQFQSKDDDRPTNFQSKDDDRPTNIQSKDDDQLFFNDHNSRPDITIPQRSQEDDRPYKDDRSSETVKSEHQKRRPQKHDLHSEHENRSPEQIRYSDDPYIKHNHNKKTTELRERTTTESIFEKVVLGKLKDSSEKEYVTMETETQSARYKSKKEKIIDSFSDVKSSRDENKYKVLNVFSDEEPTTSKNKEGVYYYDETLNYDKEKRNQRSREETDERRKLMLERDTKNREGVIKPYADQLEWVKSKKHGDDTDAGIAVTVMEVNSKDKDKVVNPNIRLHAMNVNKSVRKPKKATVIPKRDFYKLSSPNYLLKMPIIGEKYHFDEPIPEEDRNPENLKYIGNPAASINGKMSLSQ